MKMAPKQATANPSNINKKTVISQTLEFEPDDAIQTFENDVHHLHCRMENLHMHLNPFQQYQENTGKDDKSRIMHF